MDNDTGRSFAFNIAFTMRVNPPSTTPALSASEFWTGLRRGATSAQDFAEYIQDCIQLPGGKSATEFRRRLILAGGAVHSPAGVELEQDIRISEDLLVEATTIDSGARTTMILSYGAAEDETEKDLYLTAFYELRMPDIRPGTAEARDIEVRYSALARGAARTTIETIRKFKVDGIL